MKVRLGTIIAVAALAAQARSVDVTCWRGETTARIIHGYARVGAAPDGFEKVSLKPGEAKRVSFAVSRDDLKIMGPGMRWVFEPGEFEFRVGASSEDIRQRARLHLK